MTGTKWGCDDVVASGTAPALIECHDCGLILRPKALPASGGKAKCPRCGAGLYRSTHRAIDHAIALNLAGLVLFAIACLFPFMTFKLEGRVQTSTLITGVLEFWDQGLWPLAALVLAVTIVIPLAKMLATLTVLVPVRFGLRVRGLGHLFRAVEVMHPWAMMEVFMLGVLVAYVKLTDLATLELGRALFAFSVLIFILAAAEASIEPRNIWARLGDQGLRKLPKHRARDRIVGCHACGLVLDLSQTKPGHAACPRCGAGLHYRKPNSLSRTWALVITAAVLYIPANVFPVMTVISFGHGEPDTILSGVKALVAANMWPLALLVFFASITVPVLKLSGLTFLLVSVQRKSSWRLRDRTVLFRIIESVGRWSMIDIFMISILIALVKLQAIATIEPGIGATSFAGVVVITMIASMMFDPRLMWDAAEGKIDGSQRAAA
jgi:paraquat-inducible protein A